MSLKDRFANHSDTPAEQPQPEEQKSVELYDTPGHARNICFVQADGSMTFLNYAYLVCGEFNSNTGEVKLGFTTHLIIINGEKLDALYSLFLDHSIKSVRCINLRYNKVFDDKNITVTEMKILDKP